MKRQFALYIGVLLFFGLNYSFAGKNNILQSNNSPQRTAENVTKKNRQNSKYLPDCIIVKLKPQRNLIKSQRSFGIQSLDVMASRFSVQSISQMFPSHISPLNPNDVDLSNFYVMKYSAPTDAFDVANEISKDNAVEYAEPRFIYQIDASLCPPNDSLFNLQWGAKKIHADSAWCVSTGDTTAIVAIVDQGVQLDHPDLAANIWINQGEYGPGSGGRKESNGIDDDGNGKIDDWHGWDFGGVDYNNPVEDNNPSPTGPNNFHGTEVAGVSSAVANNSKGVAGIAYKSRILALKTTSDNDTRASGLAYIVYWLEALVYAADMGATVINCSFGGAGASSSEQDIINYVARKGSLIVAAAGNDLTGSHELEPVYPAWYDNVISTVATTQSDVKSSYSYYGISADVCAPGDGIYTTAISSGYNTAALGTSFAAPHVSGLVALIKSKFPTFTGAQLGEQVRATCDTSIYSVGANFTYRNLLGKGRIDAYRALTDTVTPSLRMIAFETRDSATGNVVTPVPNQTVNLNIGVRNFLRATTPSATMSLSIYPIFDTIYATIVNGTFDIGAVSMMDSVSNAGSPFVLHFKNVPYSNVKLKFLLKITDVNYSDVQIFQVLVNPTYATHGSNNLQVTLTNNGKIGFNDFPSNTQGVGFVYGEGNQLYEGGFMLGTSATKLVDVTRNDAGIQDADFSSAGIYRFGPDTIANQLGSSTFSDSATSPTNKIGVRVDMHSYAFNTTGDSDYVILQYTLGNISGATISNLYAGLFFDWDILGPQLDYFNYNRTSFDASRNLGYAFYDTTGDPTHCGVRALSGASGYRGLINDANIDLTRAGKWSWLSGGIVPLNTRGDIHFAISSGPYSLANGTHVNVAFALVAGKGLAALQTHADAALAKWNSISAAVGVTEKPSVVPTTFALYQNYPNPFNPLTRISYDIPKTIQVTLKIFDIIGREVATIINSVQSAGKYEAEFDASHLSSGIYFYRLSAGEYTSIKKLVLLK